MDFTLQDIQNQFDEKTFRLGSEYADKGHVQHIQHIGDQIRAKVNGETGYQQAISLQPLRKGVYFQGKCTCPTGQNCKHVVAVLLTLLQKKKAAAQAAPPVSPPVAAWLQRIRNTALGPQEPVSAPEFTSADKTLKRLLFVLSPAQSGRHILLTLFAARLRANGEIASATPVSDLSSLLAEPSDLLQPGDEHLVRLFIAMRSGNASVGASTAEPRGIIGGQLLRALMDRQQLLWTNSPADMGKGLVFPLRAAPTRDAHLTWREDGQMLRLAWEFVSQKGEKPGDTGSSRKIDYILPTDPPWFMDNLSCGELRLPSGKSTISIKDLQELVAQAPPVPVRDKAAVSHLLLAQGLSHIVPPPEPLKEFVRDNVKPKPFLRLGSVLQASGAPGVTHGDGGWLDFAILTFDYEGQRVPLGTSLPVMRPREDGIERIVRDQQAEDAYFRTLASFGFARPSEIGSPLSGLQGALELPNQARWLRFTREDLPVLLTQGWRIEKTAEYRYDLAEVEGWYAKVDDKSGERGVTDWFDLELGVVVNKNRISLLPVLVALIRSGPADFDPKKLALHADGDPLLVTLPDGVRIALPWGRIKPILRILGELYFTERNEPSIRLHTLDSARLADLADSVQLSWEGGERLREMGQKLAAFDGVRKVAPPRGLRAELRDYQIEGLSWMQFLREYDLAGILADDMGLGKTIQTLAHILVEKEAGRLTKPVLVVAPTSLMSNWQDEAARFAPDLRVLVLQGKDRMQRFERIDQYDLVLTTYALLPRDELELLEREYHLLILDESQYIKNNRSKAAQIAVMLRARHRLCLTGTPLENHLGELWSQFHFLLPGLLGNEKAFNSEFRHPIEKLGDEGRRALLTRRIKPFLLRRTKDKVAEELPSKTEMVRSIELTGGQRDMYETVRLAMDKKVRDEITRKGVARSQIVILEALLKLRQVCCDPRLVRTGAAKKAHATSAKLTQLLEMLDELLLENRKILVFSQFTSMLSLIEAELNARRIPYVILTGDTVDRAGAVRAFQQGAVPVFLISLKAGGVGLNLTAADTVIHYDPWWNPAAENQATDRAWRIGQDKPVFVYKLIARGTLEEKIQALQQKKAELAYAMLGAGQANSVEITPEDLQAIFAPLEEMEEEELS